MFTAAEYRRIRERSLAELRALLSALEISEPDWEAGNEFRTYEALDEEIVKRLCRLMKSDNVINGYVKLLGLGGISVDYSETDNELLDMIVRNRDAIARGAVQVIRAEPTTVETRPLQRVRKVERTESIGGLIVGGLMMIVVAVVLMINDVNPIAAGISGVAGVIAAGLGLKGRTVVEEATVEETPAPTVKAETKPTPFTATEIQRALDILSRADKIVRSL